MSMRKLSSGEECKTLQGKETEKESVIINSTGKNADVA